MTPAQLLTRWLERLAIVPDEMASVVPEEYQPLVRQRVAAVVQELFNDIDATLKRFPQT